MGFAAGPADLVRDTLASQQVRMGGCAGPTRLRQVMRERLELPTWAGSLSACG